MTAELDRNATRWIGRPQVGRFYGDFLCMTSIRENKIFSGKYRLVPRIYFRSKAWPQFSCVRVPSNHLETLADFGGK